eukprot:TRINITY_DN1671_c0_g1::TRINITY_DN1671_c0_g1_i1::g.17663::m.17663 TRINITY_DN1671_c0_g1::TRINITY_DN1671_c0_g1_i1::g.17663  ORF type:complete len:606 (+),score=232.95,Peptidase_M64/PF09471.5/7.1e-34,Peptidase_M66/PF10462.4/0.011 TRINITY_DN1671_c0_g1_i1:42-1820(+)
MLKIGSLALLALSSQVAALPVSISNELKSTSVFYPHDETVHSVKYLHNTETRACELLSSGPSIHRLAQNADNVIVERRPAITEEHTQVGPMDYVQVYGQELNVKDFMHAECDTVEVASTESLDDGATDEVIQFVNSGSSSNRIDVVLMGDGYTLAERDKYVDDMNRLITEMFNGPTFQTYLPVFNVWGVFRPSQDSGIGSGGKPKNTAFGLYRDGTELRGVYCSKSRDARNACTKTGSNACDFPSLIGNDDYYGGLGGEFTITTRSPTSGTVVLRHEMGHNFGDVGEEYDGGQVYSGANSASTLDSAKSKWGQWLNAGQDKALVAEDSNMLVQDYAWYDLAKGAYTIEFTSAGTYDLWQLVFTASGVEVDAALKVFLDGQPLEFKSHGNLDRGFHTYKVHERLSAGKHTLVFEQGMPSTTGQIRQLCSVTMLEYKDDANGFHWEDFTGAYKTWNVYNKMIGYRPDNERCLMRNMTSTHFCNACYENMWLQFFKKMTLLDGVEVATANAETTIKAALVPLADLRPVDKQRPGEKFVISWYKNGQLRTDLQDQKQFTLPHADATGSWEVKAEFITPEVRMDAQNLLHASKKFTV